MIQIKIIERVSLGAFFLMPWLLGASDWCKVSDEMQFSRTELSNGDYCEFLNACARQDVYALWVPLMSDGPWGGIVRYGNPGAYVYTVKIGWERKPVTYVSWESAARYCNWLSYGKPDSGKSELGTTEGDESFGVYDTRLFGTCEFIGSVKTVHRRTSAAYFLPTADEWRHAAAHAGLTKGRANVRGRTWAWPYPHVAEVGDGITNAYGLVNMQGNVAEWVETRRGSFMLALGGSLIRGVYSTLPEFSEGDESNKPIGSFGIRVASAINPQMLPKPGVQQLVPKKNTKNYSGSKDWCLIGLPGNRRDPIYHVGEVDYVFENWVAD